VVSEDHREEISRNFVLDVTESSLHYVLRPQLPISITLSMKIIGPQLL